MNSLNTIIANAMEKSKLGEAGFDERDIFSPPSTEEKIYFDDTLQYMMITMMNMIFSVHLLLRRKLVMIIICLLYLMTMVIRIIMIVSNWKKVRFGEVVIPKQISAPRCKNS
jgi:hypothetical protein